MLSMIHLVCMQVEIIGHRLIVNWSSDKFSLCCTLWLLGLKKCFSRYFEKGCVILRRKKKKARERERDRDRDRDRERGGADIIVWT